MTWFRRRKRLTSCMLPDNIAAIEQILDDLGA